MCLACAWHVLGMCLACAWHVLGMCLACAWHVLGMCLACACVPPEVWHVPGSLKSACCQLGWTDLDNLSWPVLGGFMRALAPDLPLRTLVSLWMAAQLNLPNYKQVVEMLYKQWHLLPPVVQAALYKQLHEEILEQPAPQLQNWVTCGHQYLTQQLRAAKKQAALHTCNIQMFFQPMT